MTSVERVLVVPTGTSAFAIALAAALGADGTAVATVPVGAPSRDELSAALATHAAPATVVHVCGDDEAVAPEAIDATETSDGDARGERVLRASLVALQAAHGLLAATGGSVVLVTVTTGISGAPSLVPFVTAVEGVRAMAKSAARQWGGLGITVNTVLVPLDLLAPTAVGLTEFLPPPALGIPSTVADVAAAVTAFGPGTTGATLVVDGGSVMAP